MSFAEQTRYEDPAECAEDVGRCTSLNLWVTYQVGVSFMAYTTAVRQG